MNNDHFLYSYELRSDGKAVVLDLNENPNLSKPKDGYNWLHMCAVHPSSRSFFETHTDLEPIIIDALLTEETRPRALIKNKGMLVILRAMNLYEGEDPEDMISIRLWIDEHRVISTRRRDIKAIQDIMGFIEAGEPPSTPADFLVAITDRLFERMEPFFVDLEDRVAEAEELLATGKAASISQDVDLVRKRTAIFTRYVTPQKILLETVLKADFKWLKDEHKEHLTESLDRVTRYVEELSELNSRSQILTDGLNNAHGRRLNDITYIFSVVATIFLPLGFLTGMMGINIGGMPGVENDWAFWIFGGLCTLLALLQVILFKRLEWF